jgi:UrcA family protein
MDVRPAAGPSAEIGLTHRRTANDFQEIRAHPFSHLPHRRLKNGRIEMFTRLSKIAAVLSGVTASLMIAAPANAQRGPVVVYGHGNQDVRTERVSYADLNLATQPGERKLFRRVSDAVKRVCLYRDGTIGLQSNGYTICADGAWDSANPQIAQAVQRAKDIAMTGKSSIAAAAITISVR